MLLLSVRLFLVRGCHNRAPVRELRPFEAGLYGALGSRLVSLWPAVGVNKAVLDRIIRVDHAGEYGANRIYAGQMAILSRTAAGPVIQHMWTQEKAHLEKFEELMVEHRVRPTILMPFWYLSGFALGAGTALLGKQAAMACTVAIEESIAEHYNGQIRTLMEEDPEKYQYLLQVIKKFRDEELEHHDTGLEHNAELAPAYSVLKNIIQIGCKAAIFLSERI
ncbi:5-demethoxyubiquinone hydroxylase, mitochondrial [Protopterus annectens]|uniref:5-demethoxyubiquinone hydroxylase, mitochondrial n=1 Tax=Protopterus annectens TaxID=7888 RepID=UPI001CF9EBCA|nr:5-demethoxyubiquinone hydroxylase, mitochondrial [Protopterus annectens]